MPLLAFTFVALLGISINTENSGGVKSLDEAKHKFVLAVKDPKPVYRVNE